MEEAGFWAALDEQPDHWQLRLVFADWLEEQGDKRAMGVRALGVLRKWAKRAEVDLRDHWWNIMRVELDDDYSRLPEDWFTLLSDNQAYAMWPTFGVIKSRQEVESTAALAFLRLPPERQAELLTAAAVG